MLSCSCFSAAPLDLHLVASRAGLPPRQHGLLVAAAHGPVPEGVLEVGLYVLSCTHLFDLLFIWLAYMCVLVCLFYSFSEGVLIVVEGRRAEDLVPGAVAVPGVILFMVLYGFVYMFMSMLCCVLCLLLLLFVTHDYLYVCIHILSIYIYI